MARRGYTVLAYLEDFLIIEPTQLQCKAAFDILLNLLESLGFTVNWTKVVFPAQCLVFLGVEIDTFKYELPLSEDRVSMKPVENVNAPSFTSNDSLTSSIGQHVLFEGAARFSGVLSPWQMLLNARITVFI